MEQFRFGDVVRIKISENESALGLVVGKTSGGKMPNVLCAQIVPVSPEGAVPLFTEVIPGVGIALLNIIFPPPRELLTREGNSIHEDRHEDVSRRVRYLFGI